MRNFTMVSPRLWQERRFSKLTPGARLVMLYMMTSPHQNSVGAYHIPDGYACADMGMSADEYEAFRQEVETAGLILFDRETSEVYIPGWFELNGVTNENHYQGSARIIDQLQSESLAEAAKEELERSYDDWQAAGVERKRRKQPAMPDVNSTEGDGRLRSVG